MGSADDHFGYPGFEAWQYRAPLNNGKCSLRDQKGADARRKPKARLVVLGEVYTGFAGEKNCLSTALILDLSGSQRAFAIIQRCPCFYTSFPRFLRLVFNPDRVEHVVSSICTQ